MSDAYERDLVLFIDEAQKLWDVREPYRLAKECIRTNPHYPKPATGEEAAFLNGANCILGIIQRRERNIRSAFPAEEAETFNMQALNLEVRVLIEMIEEFNRSQGSKK